MINRKIAPENKNIEFKSLLNPNKDFINNIPIFFLKDNKYPVIKFDLICNSGAWFEPKIGIATFAAKMLRGGTKTKNNTEIEKVLDYYGCNFNINLKRDFCNISILTLNKYFDPILKILKDILFNSSFPNAYFQLQKQIVKDKVLLEDSKNSNLAIKTLLELVFGKDHPYGNRLSPKIIDNLKLNEVKEYYLKNLFTNSEIFICGDFKKNDINDIKQSFKFLNYTTYKKEIPVHQYKPLIKTISRKESIQDSVIIGKPFPIKTDEDYINLVILNELLGGYFGSRLMSNIREKSGYTYGIYSRILPMKENSLFYIASEVSKGYASKVLKEIEKEIEKLKFVLVSNEELSTLKQYMKGKLLLSIDGTFDKMDSFINAHKFGLDNSYYSKLYYAIDKINSIILKDLAKKFLDYETFCQVIIE